jgi:hypothetical protein
MTAVRFRFGFAMCGLLSMLGAGCKSPAPYQFGAGWRNAPPAACDACGGDKVVEVGEGKPNRFIDGVGWFVGIPSKILLWNCRANNHHVTPATTAAVVEYLDRNELDDVCVRVNQYAPGGEWRRLCANRQVGAGWRYTVGTLSLVGYTILPGRVFGGDRYNPYTNSVYLYSDVPALGLQASAYAKDVHSRKHPGSYSAVNELPIVCLWHETIAAKDSLSYLRETGDYEQQLDGIRTIHPSYGMALGRTVDGLFLGWPIGQVSGAIAGHLTAWRESSLLDPPAEPSSPQDSAPLTGGSIQAGLWSASAN